MTAPLRRAAFLDRDGTLIEDVHFLRDPDLMRLHEGAAAAVRRLNDAGVLVFVVTNQSGIARGLVSEAEYEATAARLEALLAAQGAVLTRTYHCPHHPDLTGPCECRKPGTLSHRRAAAEYGVDLTRSLYAGNRYADVEPGLVLGGVVRLVPSGSTPAEEVERARAAGLVAATLERAVDDYLTPNPP